MWVVVSKSKCKGVQAEQLAYQPIICAVIVRRQSMKVIAANDAYSQN